MARIVSVAASSAEVKYFTVINTNKFGDSVYSGEIPQSDVGNKRYTRVEFDEFGRNIKSISFLKGQVTGKSERYYPDNSKFFIVVYSYNPDGSTRGVSRIDRQPRGERIKSEYRTPSGEMTSFSIYEYFDDRYEVIAYTKEGKELNKYENIFDSTGMVYNSNWYPANENKICYESFIDLLTGRTTHRVKWRVTKSRDKWVEIMRTKYFFDNDGLVDIEELYSKSGSHYGTNKYEDGLLMTKQYTFGQNKEILNFKYNKNRLFTEAMLYWDNRLVCRFVYQREPNGQIIKTVAYDPNGELMAEYYNRAVYNINSDGTPIDVENPDCIIHKKPPEWSKKGMPKQ